MTHVERAAEEEWTGQGPWTLAREILTGQAHSVGARRGPVSSVRGFLGRYDGAPTSEGFCAAPE